MQIGIVSTRLAGVDGVTFEAPTGRWRSERMGYQVRMCSGAGRRAAPCARLIPPMHFT